MQAEIGYALARSSWGQGVMREVLPVIITFGFERLKLQQIKARTAPQNLRSIKLLEYLGFVCTEGVPGSGAHNGPVWQPMRFLLQRTGSVTRGVPLHHGTQGAGAAPQRLLIRPVHLAAFLQHGDRLIVGVPEGMQRALRPQLP